MKEDESIPPIEEILGPLPPPTPVPTDRTIDEQPPQPEADTALLHKLLTTRVQVPIRSLYDLAHKEGSAPERLSAILSHQVEVSIEELLKINAAPWHDVLQRINRGFHAHYSEQSPILPSPGASLSIAEQQVLGAQFESDDTSFVLPIKANGIEIPTILDTGAGVRIMSFDCWKK